MPELEHADVRHEYSDFNPCMVAVIGGATAILIAAGLLVVWLLFRYYDRREQQAKESTLPLTAEELEQFRGQPPLEGMLVRPDRAPNADRERLESFGWVDRDKGVVHVPLERAAREALANKETYLKSKPKP